MKKYLALALVPAVILVAACGSGGPEESATAADTETTTNPVVDDTAGAVADGIESQSEAQDIAQQFIDAAPGGFVKICRGADLLGTDKATKMGVRILGPTIVKQGGSPSEVMAAMLDQC